jgi:asparagine synthase (glutamine-hydrolysing)
MLDRIAHRGPDGAGQFATPDGDAGLAHVHLGAFERAGGIRPAFGHTPEAAVAIDGCVTNAREVLGALAGSVHDGSSLDLQAARLAYEAWGDDCLAKLDGPFGMALVDRSKGRLLLSRDKLGEKSLYYWIDPADGTVIFGSEVKAILAHPSVRAELDPEGLALYLAFGYIPGPRTLFRGIHKLLPGERLTRDSLAPASRAKYWRLPAIADGVTDEGYCIGRLRELFMRGLEAYVNGCDTVGVFLSGGVDSSIIVAGLRELGVPRVHTFTVAFDVNAGAPHLRQDLDYARLVAGRFGTAHHEVLVTNGGGFPSRLLRVVRQFDDLIMTPNTYSKYVLAEAARKAGVTSVLTGSAAAGACGVHRKYLDHQKRARLERKIRDCPTDEARYYKLRSGLFDLEDQRVLLKHPPSLDRAAILDVLHEYIGDVRSPDFFRLFLFSNLMITSTEKTLKVLDRSGSLASVEIRSPYLDRALVEFSTQLPSSFDGGQTYVSLKTHLKKAFADVLPQAVLEREVVGYPSYYWNDGSLARLQERLLGRDAIASNGILDYDGVMRILEAERHSDDRSVGKHSWALTEFCLWYEIHIKQNPSFAEEPDLIEV